MYQIIDDGFKFDLREMLDIAVEAKRAYWDANRDVELMFCDGLGNLPDEASMRIEDEISSLASASAHDIGEKDVETFLKNVLPFVEDQS